MQLTLVQFSEQSVMTLIHVVQIVKSKLEVFRFNEVMLNMIARLAPIN
jgi:hypothetical protein